MSQSVNEQVGFLRSKKTELEQQVARLERELDLVKSKGECKVLSLEENLERASLTCAQLRNEIERVVNERKKVQDELSGLLDNLIDQQTEIVNLQRRQALIDAELHRKDKDAKALLAAVRRYKSRVEYFRTKMRSRNRRRSKDDEFDTMNASSIIAGNGSSIITGPASVDDDADASPYNGSILTLGGASSLGTRRDSIPIPGYMTAEEEYFRLVVLAAKLNVAGTSTPSTYDNDGVSNLDDFADCTQHSGIEEVNEADIDPSSMYNQVQAEKVPFHRWHDWAQEYVVSHHMPPLMGVIDSSKPVPEEVKKQRFVLARKLLTGGKNKLKALTRIFPRKKRQPSIGIAA